MASDRLNAQIRLSPNFIKNNFHWEMADGKLADCRWELGERPELPALAKRRLNAEG